MYLYKHLQLTQKPPKGLKTALRSMFESASPDEPPIDTVKRALITTKNKEHYKYLSEVFIIIVMALSKTDPTLYNLIPDNILNSTQQLFTLINGWNQAIMSYDIGEDERQDKLIRAQKELKSLLKERPYATTLKDKKILDHRMDKTMDLINSLTRYNGQATDDNPILYEAWFDSAPIIEEVSFIRYSNDRKTSGESRKHRSIMLINKSTNVTKSFKSIKECAAYFEMSVQGLNMWINGKFKSKAMENWKILKVINK